jgi:hypothetical protein
MATTYSDGINYGSFIHTNSFLSNFLLGYKLANPVADFVAPPFLVNRPSDKYGIYNKTINIVYQNEVAGNEEPKEIGYEVTQAAFACKEFQLSKGVNWRSKRLTDTPWNLDFDAVRFLKRAQAIAREYRVAAIAASASFVTAGISSGSAPWSVVATGTPVDDIIQGMSSVTGTTGGYTPNRIVLPTPVALNMVKTTNWKDYFKWSSAGFGNGLFSVADGLKNLGLEPMMTAVQGTTSLAVSGSDPGMATIWGNNVLLFYCEPNPSLETRTFMYSPYTLRDVIETVPQKTKRRDLHTIYEEITELLVDANCAYLIATT